MLIDISVNWHCFSKSIYLHQAKRRALEVRYKMAIDPVCKMTVDEKTAKLKSDYKGKTYYFCAPGCKKAFEGNPDKYLGK